MDSLQPGFGLKIATARIRPNILKRCGSVSLEPSIGICFGQGEDPSLNL